MVSKVKYRKKNDWWIDEKILVQIKFGTEEINEYKKSTKKFLATMLNR